MVMDRKSFDSMIPHCICFGESPDSVLGQTQMGLGLLCLCDSWVVVFTELSWIENSMPLRLNELSQLRQFGPPTCKESDFCQGLEAVQVKSEYDTQKYMLENIKRKNENISHWLQCLLLKSSFLEMKSTS